MLNKIIEVLTKNLIYSIILVCGIILFLVFSDGVLKGIITAISALIVYTCVDILYKEYKKTPTTIKVKKVTKTKNKKK